MLNIKEDYGDHFNWVLPFPGDWHTLYNYQKALMKAYADAGLAHFGKSSGHRSETLSTSLINSSNFKRTHYFLIQVMAFLTQFFLELYINKSNQQHSNAIELEIARILDSFASITDDSQLPKFNDTVDSQLKMCVSQTDFMDFMTNLTAKQDTVKLWFQFLTNDCLAYTGLYTAVRHQTGNCALEA